MKSDLHCCPTWTSPNLHDLASLYYYIALLRALLKLRGHQVGGCKSDELSKQLLKHHKSVSCKCHDRRWASQGDSCHINSANLPNRTQKESPRTSLTFLHINRTPHFSWPAPPLWTCSSPVPLPVSSSLVFFITYKAGVRTEQK